MRQPFGAGDHLHTSLFDGSRIEKDDPILELIGNLDELNAFIGLGIYEIKDKGIGQELNYIQVSISRMMSFIAGANQKITTNFSLKNFLERIELQISSIKENIIKPKEFTFSGVSKIGAIFDICRTVARRAERSAVKYQRIESQLHPEIVPILNRLSTLFYFMRLKVEQEPKQSTD